MPEAINAREHLDQTADSQPTLESASPHAKCGQLPAAHVARLTLRDASHTPSDAQPAFFASLLIHLMYIAGKNVWFAPLDDRF